jgi:cytoskeleton protein RodZ
MESFGAYLKQVRETKKVSLDEICRATKIRRSILEAIEGDRLEILPSEVFVKGFIEAYANYIGLDTEDVLSRYKGWRRDYMAAGEQEAFIVGESHVLKRYIIAGIFLLGIILLLFLLLYEKRLKEIPIPETRTDQGVTSPTDNSQSPPFTPSAVEPVPMPPQTESVEKQEEPIKKREHILVIEAFERTWIEITEDSSPPFDITLYPGERYTRTGYSHFMILVGNAGGIKVTFDGKELEPLGEVGQVVKLTLPPMREE